MKGCKGNWTIFDTEQNIADSQMSVILGNSLYLSQILEGRE